MAKDVLIIATDPSDKRLVKSLLEPENIKFEICGDTQEALGLIKETDFSLAVISPPVERMQATELKNKIQQIRPRTKVIVLSSFRNVRSSNDVLRYGPPDYIVHQDDLLSLIITGRSTVRRRRAL